MLCLKNELNLFFWFDLLPKFFRHGTSIWIIFKHTNEEFDIMMRWKVHSLAHKYSNVHFKKSLVWYERRAERKRHTNDTTTSNGIPKYATRHCRNDGIICLYDMRTNICADMRVRNDDWTQLFRRHTFRTCVFPTVCIFACVAHIRRVFQLQAWHECQAYSHSWHIRFKRVFRRIYQREHKPLCQPLHHRGCVLIM